MAQTLVSDVIVPEVFLPYSIQRTAELSEFVQSGIIQPDSQFDAKASDGGKIVEMPFWNDLTGEDEVIDDENPLGTDKIAASGDAAAIHQRGKAWSVNDLAGMLAGDDPMKAIGNLTGEYWARRLQAQSFATLKGVFAIASMANSLHAIHAATGTTSSANFLTGATFIDAQQKLGDSKSKLVAISMHSRVESALRKLDLIDTIPASESKPEIKFFQGLRVIIDDGHTVETINTYNVYTTYLFGAGALALGNDRRIIPVEGAPAGSTWNLEMSRTALAGSTALIHRRRFILHPRGVKWLGVTQAKKSPSNTELGSDTNWLRVYETKNVRIVKITHNIPA